MSDLNVSDPSATTSLSYLEQLLHSALAQPGAASNPIAGRVVMALLGLAMAQGGDRLIAFYLGPTPGEDAVHQVRRIDPGDRTLTILSDDLSAVAALRTAIRMGRDGVGGIQVVARSARAVERCAVNRSTEGVLEYIFPSVDAYSGPPEAVEGALKGWRDIFRRWEAALESPPTPTTAAEGGDLAFDSRRQRAAGNSAAGNSEGMPTAAEIAEAIQSSLMQMTVDINLTEVEDLIRRTIASALDGLGDRPALATGIGRTATPPELSPAVVHKLADLVVGRLAERLGGTLRGATERTAEAAAQRASAKVARLVSDELATMAHPGSDAREGPAWEKVGPALSEMSASHERLLAGLSSQIGLSPRILGAVEHLDLQAQEMREQVRTSYGVLQALAEQVDELTRRSDSSGERLAATVGRELDQFGDRLRHQLVDMQTSARRSAVDSAVSEEVTRLTRKLIRTEAQFEQVLERLQEVVGPDLHRPIG